METERSNLPADLPTLAREIDAALARDVEFEDEYRNREAALWQEFEHQRSRLVQDIDQRRLPYRIELGQLLNAGRVQFTRARDFDQWVRENTRVSRTVAYECMKLARADDPEAADGERRAGQAKRKRGLRAGSSGTANVPDGLLAQEPREPITYVPPPPATPAPERAAVRFTLGQLLTNDLIKWGYSDAEMREIEQLFTQVAAWWARARPGGQIAFLDMVSVLVSDLMDAEENPKERDVIVGLLREQFGGYRRSRRRVSSKQAERGSGADQPVQATQA